MKRQLEARAVAGGRAAEAELAGPGRGGQGLSRSDGGEIEARASLCSTQRICLDARKKAEPLRLRPLLASKPRERSCRRLCRAQAKTDAAALAQEEAKAAAAAASRAADAAETAKQNTSPLSVFISRKTQRLYIRRGNIPVFESPVTIRDPGGPIGTFVFTALNYAAAPGRMRWNVVSMYKDATNIEPYSEAKRESKKQRHTKPADVAGAQLALDRLVIPQEALDRISEVLLPGSSLIVSDEGPSNETGKDTDFIVFMSGEPQGGIASRGTIMAQPTHLATGSCHAGKEGRQVRPPPGPEAVRCGETGDMLLSRHSLAFECNLAPRL